MMARIRRGRRRRTTAFLLLVALVCLACGSERSSAPNILLISIDSLRADRLGCYGAERATSPAIDALAASGVLFENAVAPSPWTLPSHVSLMTGLSTAVHSVSAPTQRINPARQLLAEALRDQGYRTAAFVSAPYLDRAYGFDRGFGHYDNLQAASERGVAPGKLDHDRSHLDQTADQVTDRALAWLRDAVALPEPWFLFVHLWDVHYDYLPPAPYDRYFDVGDASGIDGRNFLGNPRIHAGMPAEELAEVKALYDREVRAIDAQIARLLAALDGREDVLIALVSDHGDEFFEHGHKGHTRSLFEESVRIPWLVRLPDGESAGLRVAAPASLEDVAPTLLSLAGLSGMPEASGRDLSSLVRGGAMADAPVLLTFPPYAALRGADWKILANGRTGAVRYFDLRADPAEQHPLEAPAEALDLLKQRIERAESQVAALPWYGDDEVELDQETADRLRELGYVE